MKYLLYIFFIIGSAFSIFAQNSKTNVIINTGLVSSYIYINGRLEGRGTADILLPEGKYEVCIKESLIRWSGAEIVDTLRITGKEGRIEKHYALVKRLLFDSSPQNAKVMKADSLIGYTPLMMAPDLKNVKVIKDNYQPQNALISPGEKNVINLGEPVNGRGKSFTRSPWFKALLGTAAVLGAVAAYHKIKADRKYDDYLSSKNAAALDEVNRLDNISNIAFGALQVNFGALIYFLLTDD